MFPPNSNKYVPPHRRSLWQNQSRLPPAQAQEPPRPPAHNNFDTLAYRQGYSTNFLPLQPQPISFPSPQASHESNVSPFPNPVAKTLSPPPKALLESQAIHGSRKKERIYPELQKNTPVEPSPNRYQQAISYIDGVVKKTADILPMAYSDIDSGQQIPSELCNNAPQLPTPPLKIAPLSPILRKLQANREGGYYLLSDRSGQSKAGYPRIIHDIKRQISIVPGQTPLAAQTKTATDSYGAYEKEFACADYKKSNVGLEADNIRQQKGHGRLIKKGNSRTGSSLPIPSGTEHRKSSKNSSADQDLIDSMQSLRIFEGLRPMSQHSQQSPSDALEERRKMESTSTAQTVADEEHAMPFGTVDPRRAYLIDHGPTVPSEIIAERNLPQCTEENSPKSSATAISHEPAPTHLVSTKEDVTRDHKSDVIEYTKPTLEANNQEDVFTNIELRSPTPSTTPSSPDNDFEVITQEGYQTQQNSRPRIWRRWVQSKR